MRRLALPVLSLVLLGGCRGDEPRLADTPPDTLPPVGQVQVQPGSLPPGVDPEAVRVEADSLDAHARELRAHIASMRQIPPPQVGPALQRHAERVRALAARIQQQRATLGVGDEALATLLGMGADEYRVMLEEVRLAGAEVDELRAGGEAAARDRLPGHLDRLERLAGQLEHASAALRR